MADDTKVVAGLLEAISWSLPFLHGPMSDQNARNVRVRLHDAKLSAERAMAPEPAGPPVEPLTEQELADRYREVQRAAADSARICEEAQRLLVRTGFALAEQAAAMWGSKE